MTRRNLIWYYYVDVAEILYVIVLDFTNDKCFFNNPSGTGQALDIGADVC